MSKTFTPKVVTANDLFEGDVIYLDKNQDWTRHLQEAELLDNQDKADEWLSFALAQKDQIVGAYLAEAELGENGMPEPIHFREAFRMRGPSNYPDHGKQAEQ